MEDPLIFKILATAALTLSTLFIGLLCTEPWRKHWFGVSVMLMTIGIWLLELAGVLRQWLGPDYGLRDEVRALGQLFIVAALAERVVELVVVKLHRIRRRGSRTPTA